MLSIEEVKMFNRSIDKFNKCDTSDMYETLDVAISISFWLHKCYDLVQENVIVDKNDMILKQCCIADEFIQLIRSSIKNELLRFKHGYYYYCGYFSKAYIH